MNKLLITGCLILLLLNCTHTTTENGTPKNKTSINYNNYFTTTSFNSPPSLEPYSIYTYNNYLFICCGNSGLKIHNLNTLDNEVINQKLNSNPINEQPAFTITIKDEYAYINSGKTLTIADITNIYAPIIINTIENEDWIEAILISRNHIFIKSNNRITVYNKQTLAKIDTITINFNKYKLLIHDDYLYIAYSRYLMIYELHNITDIKKLKTTALPFTISDISIHKNYLIITGGKTYQWYIFTLNNHVLAKKAKIPGTAIINQIMSNDTHLFLRTGTKTYIYTVKTPETTTHIADFNNEDTGKYYLTDNYIILITNDNTIKIFAVDPMYNPRLIKEINGTHYYDDMFTNDSYIFILYNSKLLIHNAINQDLPPNKTIDLPIHAKTISGTNDAIVLSDINRNLIIMDISDINNLTEKVRLNGRFDRYLLLYGNYLFAETLSNGTVIIDLIDHTSPSTSSPIPTKIVKKIIIKGKYAYILDAIFGLIVVDISDMKTPEVIPNKTNLFTKDIIIKDYLLFEIDAFNTFSINDIFNTHKKDILYRQENFSGNNLFIHGNYLYTASDSNINVYTVSDPRSPTLIKIIPGNTRAKKYFYSEGKIFTFNHNKTISIINNLP